MRREENEVSQERKDFLKNILDYEYNSFVQLIFNTALNNEDNINNDGKVLNDCLKVFKDKVIPVNINEAHIFFNEQGLHAVSDVLMNIFKKSSIKEDISNKH